MKRLLITTLLLFSILGCSQRAPDFTAQSLNQKNKPFTLSDHRGQYVLLFFWASTSKLCRDQTPYVQKTWNAFKHDPNFTIIALSLDNNPNDAITFNRENNITYPQAYLGQWEYDTVRPAYKTRGIPAIFLINPQGNIIAVNLRDNEIYDTVKHYLTNQ
ncbi:TlpA family protein disulfide reductase [Planctomycetota bacterium]|nr:TlpA family protein disulfide reductase [Planctomycetota bacterium]